MPHFVLDRLLRKCARFVPFDITSFLCRLKLRVLSSITPSQRVSVSGCRFHRSPNVIVRSGLKFD